VGGKERKCVNSFEYEVERQDNGREHEEVVKKKKLLRQDKGLNEDEAAKKDKKNKNHSFLLVMSFSCV